MDGEGTHLSSSEIRRIIGRLRGPDLLRLAVLARNWATGLRQHDGDDLLNEALDRMLSGRRPWPSDVPLPAFFSQVMRSIATQWRREEFREPLIGDRTDDPQGDKGFDPTTGYELADQIAKMRFALRGDREALSVFDQILADRDRDDALTALGMDASQYDTARRRMARRLFETFQ